MHGVLLPELPYETDEWYEARRKSLGASEVAAALGFSSWQSAYSLWAEKTNRLPHPAANAAMRLGSMLEPVILDEFEREKGLHVVERGKSWAHPDEPWATASPDGLAAEAFDGDPLGLVEAKTDYGVWDEVPEQYQLQVAYQMWVLGVGHAWIPLLSTGRREFNVYEVERDERLIKVAVAAAREFWSHVTNDTEPPVDAHEATGKALGEVYWDPSDEAVELGEDAAYALEELKTVRRQGKTLEERRAFLENTIKQALGDSTVGTLAGALAVSWKPQTASRIDSARLRENEPDVAAAYTKESTFRVLRIKESKA